MKVKGRVEHTAFSTGVGPDDEMRETAIETRWCIMAANRRQLDGDQAWRKWKPSRSKLEANSNVCCHGRGMLQWDPEKVKPKRGETRESSLEDRRTG